MVTGWPFLFLTHTVKGVVMLRKIKTIKNLQFKTFFLGIVLALILIGNSSIALAQCSIEITQDNPYVERIKVSGQESVAINLKLEANWEAGDPEPFLRIKYETIASEKIEFSDDLDWFSHLIPPFQMTGSPLVSFVLIDNGTGEEARAWVCLDPCEGNFDNDEDVDGDDAFTFKSHFGRNLYQDPCTVDNPCNGDFFPVC